MQDAVKAEPVIADLPAVVVKELPIAEKTKLIVVHEATLRRLAQFDRVKLRVRNLRTEVKNMSKAYTLAKVRNEVLKLQNEALTREILDVKQTACICQTAE